MKPQRVKQHFNDKLVSRELGVRPLAAYDRGYGNAKFVQQTEDIEADLLLRLASNRCVWGIPVAYQGRGAPCKHGHKFKLNNPLEFGLIWIQPAIKRVVSQEVE